MGLIITHTLPIGNFTDKNCAVKVIKATAELCVKNCDIIDWIYYGQGIYFIDQPTSHQHQHYNNIIIRMSVTLFNVQEVEFGCKQRTTTQLAADKLGLEII